MSSTIPTAKKLGQLRAAMTKNSIAAYIIPSADPHQSEMVSEHWKCRQWISGFSGSAGTVVVLTDRAALWTDGRYVIQAEKELQRSDIELFKTGLPDTPKLVDWLCEQVDEGQTIGVDGRQLTVAIAEEWNKKISKKNIQLNAELNLISPLWTDRPALPSAPAMIHDSKYSGRTTAENLSEIREAMQNKKTNTYLLSSLYDIAWLCNLRGGDLPYCPVAMCYMLLTEQTATLFIDPNKLTDDVRDELTNNEITIEPYDAIEEALRSLPTETKVYFDEQRTNVFLKQQIPSHCEIITGKELTALPKAKKNATQLKHWRNVLQIDGVAMVRFLKWLEESAQNNITECDAAEKINALRCANPECVDLSFRSISAYGPNAAMAHYSAKPESCATIKPEGFYLVDSGGQYFGGTTDITRTISMGELTDEQRTDYTLVLKGMIKLSAALFLKGTAGANLDILARQALWEHGIDYKYGTGHGVGYYLNVHEGPQNLSQNTANKTPLESGMVITIEPGVYRENSHGIRIENMVCVEKSTKTDFGQFLQFETLTLCPIDTVPIKKELLSDEEIEWLNSYHASVYKKLSPLLNDAECAWLGIKTKPLPIGEAITIQNPKMQIDPFTTIS